MMLNDTLIDTLNPLIETAKDGEYGFRSSGEHARSAELKRLFLRRAAACRQAARDLQAEVARIGGSAEDAGTLSGAAHRGWVAVKGTLAGYTDLAILEEAERGEDVALARYGSALDEALSPELRALVELQYDAVKQNHAQVRALHDQARAGLR